MSACRDDNPGNELCGNGAQDEGEQCDDGNTADGDGCSATCELESQGICGDGFRSPGEQCDDGNTADGDGCSALCEVELVEVVCQELAPLSSGSCEVTEGDATTALVGDVLAPDGIYRGGTVLVDASGVISCVGCDCDTTGATVITCPEGVISPGLINSHDHLTFVQNDPYTDNGERYEHRHDWRKGLRGHTRIGAQGQASGNQLKWGELRFLISGTTSTNASGSTDGFIRNLDRSAQEGLGQPQVEYDTFPLGDSGGELLDGSCSYPNPATMADIANEDAYTPHVAEGVDDEAHNEFVCTSSNENGANDILESQTAFIHGVGLGAYDFQAMAEAGTKLIWSPRSNITLYGETARVALADNLGVQIALGTDWIPTGSMNMQRELQCADSFNKNHLGGYFTDVDLWNMAARNGAIVTATDDVIGSLAMGKVADIAIFDGSTNKDYRAVIDAQAQDTVMVMRGGEVLYGEAVITDAVGIGNCDMIDVCGSERRLCAENDIGQGYPALKAANANLYPDFFCGEPENEPSCVPFRPTSVDGSTTYTGATSDGDADGDGVANSDDNCLTVFNPIRPLDHGMQADADNDGVGDSCDPCPLNANSTDCTPVDPELRDSDGDTILDSNDNCPSDANTDQADMDTDGIGDVCDECPTVSNPGGSACPATIYEVKLGTSSIAVSISDVIVTACFDKGFYAQTITGDADFAGVENSGVFVFSPSDCGVNINIGDRVDITAEVQDFFGQTQLSNSSFIVNSANNALPTPFVITPAAASGTTANEFEGVLAQVQNVVVTDIAPPPGGGESAPTGQFEVDSTLRIDDEIFAVSPFPSNGTAFPSIVGVLSFNRGNQVLFPRDADDFILGDPTLVSLSPGLSFVNVGESNTATGPTALQVVLTHAVTVDTVVSIVSSDAASLAVVGGGVTVSIGQSTAIVLVDGLVQAAAVTLTATLDGVTASADVRVVGAAEVPAIASLTPPTSSIGTASSVTLTLSLDIPAGAGGEVVALSASPGTSVTVPATVNVAEGDLSASFDVVATDVEGSETITATLNGTATATVDVVAGNGQLVINEVDYDQADADTDEFVELFNASGATVSLNGLALIFVNGSNNSQYRRVNLDSAGSLAPGEFLVVGTSTLLATVPGGVATVDIGGASNTIQNGAPDAVGLFDVSNASFVLLDALSYEGSVIAGDTDGGTFNFVEGTATTAEDPNVDGSLSRSPNGTDTDDANSDWVFTNTSTPGVANIFN